jgi:hypothetical protein
VIDVFVDEIDLGSMGFERAEPADTGRPACATYARFSACSSVGQASH